MHFNSSNDHGTIYADTSVFNLMEFLIKIFQIHTLNLTLKDPEI